MKLTGRKSIGLGLCALLVTAWSLPVMAGGKIKIDDTRWISFGAGLRASYQSVEDGAPSGDDRSSDFEIDNMRLYVNGQAHKYVKLTFNTECLDCSGGSDSKLIVLDAIAQFEFNEYINVWMGRMLTPADRIEMNGPFYGLTWGQYTVPLFPSDQNPFADEAGREGRDDGLTIWGSVKKFQYAVGGFSGYRGDANPEDNMLFAGRFAYNFLHKEDNPGYYTSSTYYGSLDDVLTVGFFIQSQSDGVGTADDSADFLGYGVDVLFEKVFSGGVLTLEGEYKRFDVDLTDDMVDDPDCFCLFNGDAYFGTAAFLFPEAVGPGKFQPYVRYTANNPDDSFDDSYDNSDLTEIGLNYIISEHNVLLNLNYTNGDANNSGLNTGKEVDAVLFGVQIQL